MVWKCPECEYSNNDSMARCVCGYEFVDANKNQKNNRQYVQIKTSWPRVITEALIIFIATAIPTFILGLLWGIPGPDDSIELIDFKLKFYYASIVLEVIGFTIIGCLHRNNRFFHLFLVSLMLWLLGLSSYFIEPFSIGSLLKSIIHVLMAILIGGSISLLFVRRSKHP
jgi:hypothetical protein